MCILLPSLTLLTWNEETAAFLDALATTACRIGALTIRFRVLNKPLMSAYASDASALSRQSARRCALLSNARRVCGALRYITVVQNWPYTLSNVFETVARHSNVTRYRRIETFSGAIFGEHFDAVVDHRRIMPTLSNAAVALRGGGDAANT